MKITRYVLFALLFVSVAWYLFSKNLPSKPIDRIDSNDRLELEMFFRTLIYESHFGYTLFGDKPASIGGYFIQKPASDLVFWGAKPHMSLDHLWVTWKKHEHKLKIKNYILLNEPQIQSDDLRTITLINKQAFLKKVREYLDDFRAVLGADITPDKLLKQLELPNASLYETIHRNEILYGILLGFGKENAVFFLKRFKLYNIVNAPMPITENPYESYSLSFPIPNASFKDLENEFLSLEKKLHPFGWDSKFCPIQPPRFVAIKNHPETLALEKKYRDMQHKLLQIYGEGDFLTITLEQLCR